MGGFVLHSYSAKYEAGQIGQPQTLPRYEIRTVCDRNVTAEIVHWLVTTVQSSSFMLEGMKTQAASGPNQDVVVVTCRCGEWRDVGIEKLVAGLSTERGIGEASWRRLMTTVEIPHGSPL